MYVGSVCGECGECGECVWEVCVWEVCGTYVREVCEESVGSVCGECEGERVGTSTMRTHFFSGDG